MNSVTSNGAVKSDSTHHFFGNACTKSGLLRYSQFSGCWLILSVCLLVSFDFPFWKITRCSVILLLPLSDTLPWLCANRFLLLFHNYACPAANTSIIVFCLTRPGIESKIYPNRVEHANHIELSSIYIEINYITELRGNKIELSYH